mmetsp:Transcript_53287/g.158950  ORF Transcript_53287/g.158950 Transcript_53287/m.158950 type:complete len:267 (+) Transcript_53287:264-1064(+)
MEGSPLPLAKGVDAAPLRPMSCSSPTPEPSRTSSRGRSVSIRTLGRRHGKRRRTTRPQSATPSPPSSVRLSASSRSHCCQDGPGVLARVCQLASGGAVRWGGAIAAGSPPASRCAQASFTGPKAAAAGPSGRAMQPEGEAPAGASLRAPPGSVSDGLLATGSAVDPRVRKRCPTSGVHSAEEAKLKDSSESSRVGGPAVPTAGRSTRGGGSRCRNSAKSAREPPKKAWHSTSASPSGPSPGRASGRGARRAATSPRAAGWKSPGKL